MFRLKKLAILFPTLPLALLAQWPAHPTAGVPRTPDGKPDLEGPAPRTADGKPDLSGIWAFRGRLTGQGGAGIASIQPPTPAPPGTPPQSTFFNVGAGFKEGLPLQPWAAALLKERMAENSKDNPDAHCLPLGLMQLHMHPQPS